MTIITLLMILVAILLASLIWLTLIHIKTRDKLDAEKDNSQALERKLDIAHSDLDRAKSLIVKLEGKIVNIDNSLSTFGYHELRARLKKLFT